MKLNFTLLIVMILWSCISVNGQYHRCGTDEYTEAQILKDPSFAVGLQQVEDQLNQLNNSGLKSSALVTIPVVFHIVYNAASQNISDTRIQAQLNVLNDDFARLNADASNTPGVFAAVAGHTQIQFCLAQRNPMGNPTTGINRVSTTTTSFSTNDYIKSSSTGGANPWPRADYLNIWVGNLGGGLLGYAQFPTVSGAATDGVVLLYSSVGGPGAPGLGPNGNTFVPYHLGRTATHEVGHWLSLRHTWGNSSTCGDDLVADTPLQESPNFSCPSFPNVSTCPTGNNAPDGDMYMNYMDYVDDNCMNTFTNGQGTRMNNILGVAPRNTLQASLGCVPAVIGINESEKLANQLNIYPNPANGILNITLTDEKYFNSQLQVLDVLGKELYSDLVKSTSTQIDISTIPNGIYYLRITGNAGTVTKKLMIY